MMYAVFIRPLGRIILKTIGENLMRTNLLAMLAVVMFFASQATAQNLVENPSFEDPTVSTG